MEDLRNTLNGATCWLNPAWRVSRFHVEVLSGQIHLKSILPCVQGLEAVGIEKIVCGCACQTRKFLIFLTPNLTAHQYTNFAQKIQKLIAFINSSNLLKIHQIYIN